LGSSGSDFLGEKGSIKERVQNRTSKSMPKLSVPTILSMSNFGFVNGRGSAVNRALDGSTYPG
jgi:hypothetical protein